jgi:hypothetical protein
MDDWLIALMIGNSMIEVVIHLVTGRAVEFPGFASGAASSSRWRQRRAED